MTAFTFPGTETWWEQVLVVFFFITFIAALVREVLFQKDFRIDLDDDVGQAGGWAVEVMSDAKGKRYVGVGTWSDQKYVRVIITPAHARYLADLLRLAASPGHKLANARMNARKAV